MVPQSISNQPDSHDRTFESSNPRGMDVQRLHQLTGDLSLNQQRGSAGTNKNIILLKQIMVKEQMVMMNGGTCNPITGNKTRKLSDSSSLAFGSLFCSTRGTVQMFPQHFFGAS